MKNLQETILTNKLATLYGSLPTSIITNFGLAFLFYVLFNKDINDGNILWYWFGALAFAQVGRLVAYFFYNQNRNQKLFYYHFLFLTAVSGLAWGGTSIFLFYVDSDIIKLVITLYAIAIALGSFSLLIADIQTNISYIFAILAPFIVVLLFHENLKIVSYLLALDLIYILASFLKVSKNFTNLFKAEYRNNLNVRKLESYKNRLYRVVEQIPIGIFYYNKDFTIVDSNGVASEVLNLKTKRLSDFNEEIRETLQAVFIGNNGIYNGELFNGDEKLIVDMKSFTDYDEHGDIKGGIGIVSDVTSDVRAKEYIKFQAYNDSLTMLPNRKKFINDLTTFVVSKETNSALIYFDINDFSEVNDIFGHDIGNKVLIKFTQTLQKIIGTSGYIYRLGSDEMAVILHNSQNDTNAITSAGNKVQNIMNELELNPYKIDKIVTKISVSSSIISLPYGNSGVQDIMKYADIATREAKKIGQVVIFNDNLYKEFESKIVINKDFKKAIKNKELVLHYQPQIDIKSNKIVGLESLVRWEKGSDLIYPGYFIDVIEKRDTIIELGEYVLDRACSFLFELKTENHELYSSLNKISVNISANHLKYHDFVESIKGILIKHDIDYTKLEFEITENTLLNNVDDIVEKMNIFKDMGISFALDDFGTGYSSLKYIKQLPLDIIKIDKSFIDDIEFSKQDNSIVDSILYISNQIGAKVIAEGIERDMQLKILAQKGCDIYQGYLFSRAVSQEQIFKFKS